MQRIKDLNHLRTVHCPNLRAALNFIANEQTQEPGLSEAERASVKARWELTRTALAVLEQELATWEALANAITDPYTPLGGPSLPPIPPKGAPRQGRKSSPPGSSA